MRGKTRGVGNDRRSLYELYGDQRATHLPVFSDLSTIKQFLNTLSRDYRFVETKLEERFLKNEF